MEIYFTGKVKFDLREIEVCCINKKRPNNLLMQRNTMILLSSSDLSYNTFVNDSSKNLNTKSLNNRANPSKIKKKVLHIAFDQQYLFMTISQATPNQRAVLSVIYKFMDDETSTSALLHKTIQEEIPGLTRRTLQRYLQFWKAKKIINFKQKVHGKGQWGANRYSSIYAASTVRHFLARNSSTVSKEETNSIHTSIPKVLKIKKSKFLELRPKTKEQETELIDRVITKIPKKIEQAIKAEVGNTNYFDIWNAYKKHISTNSPSDYWISKTKSLYWTIDSISLQFLSFAKYSKKLKAKAEVKPETKYVSTARQPVGLVIISDHYGKGWY